MMFRPVTSVRSPASSRFAEMFLTVGPQQIGVTGDNRYQTMYGYDWLLVWDRDDGLLHLYQERDGAWHEVLDDLPPVFGSPVPVDSRRWSLAFDQSARVIVAYEDDTGTVRITRWDNVASQYIQNVSFAGVDPCVVMDASWSYYIGDSDVLIFYLSADRERVMARVQRDTYGTPYELWDYGEPVILDRVLATPYKYQVLVSNATGEPREFVLLSELYPVAVRETVRVAGEFTSGDYKQVAFDYYPPLGVAVAGEFISGALEEPVVKYEPLVGVTVTGEFISGVLKDVVTKYSPSFGVAVAGEFVSGSLDDIGVRVEPPLGVTVAGEFIGGVYEPG